MSGKVSPHKLMLFKNQSRQFSTYFACQLQAGACSFNVASSLANEILLPGEHSIVHTPPDIKNSPGFKYSKVLEGFEP